MPVDVRVLTAADTREILDIRRAVEIVEETFRWIADGQVVWSDPPVMALRIADPNAAYRLKGAYLPMRRVAGFRVTGFHLDAAGVGSGASDNTRFVILSAPTTGHPLAVIDEHWTCSVRTVAAKYLADPESSRLGLVGAGPAGHDRPRGTAAGVPGQPGPRLLAAAREPARVRGADEPHRDRAPGRRLDRGGRPRHPSSARLHLGEPPDRAGGLGRARRLPLHPRYPRQ